MDTVNALRAAVALLALVVPACAGSREDIAAGNDALREDSSSSADAVVLARAENPSATLRLSTVLDDGANLAVLEAGEGPEALRLRCGLLTATANNSMLLLCFDRAHDEGDSLTVLVGPKGSRLDLTCPDGKTTNAAFFAACDASHRLLTVEGSEVVSPPDANHDPLELARRVLAATAALSGLSIESPDGSTGVVASVEGRYGAFPGASPPDGHGVKLTATLTDGRTIDGLDYVDFRTTDGTELADVADLTDRMRLVLPHRAGN